MKRVSLPSAMADVKKRRRVVMETQMREVTYNLWAAAVCDRLVQMDDAEDQ